MRLYVTLMYLPVLICTCVVVFLYFYINTRAQDVRPEEEFCVSHIPGSVRVEPSIQPDIQTLGITSDTTGESDTTPVRVIRPL